VEKPLIDIRGKHVTVLGAGRSGVAVARLLSSKGAKVFLSETAPRETKSDEAKILAEANIPAEFGDHTSHTVQADLCVISPGIPQSSAVVKKIKSKRIPIFGELEVASWYCRSPILAVTGSNGKSTVTALLGEVFRAARKPCIVAGNIGTPFSGAVGETVPEGVAILEVSSFQLETIRRFRPHVAIFLNLTPDHLDRHGSLEDYGKLKARIFQNQTPSDYVVFNGMDSRVVALSRRAKSRKVVFGVEENRIPCGFVRSGMLTLRLEEGEETILPVNEMGIQGEHNVANGLACALAARLLGMKGEVIRRVFRLFKGLPHRMEFVRELDGVGWVNDSKATNVDSVWYALGSYSKPVVLIAGGRDKDSDFTVLRERIRERTRGVILLGEAAEKMAKAFQGVSSLVKAGSLKEAVLKAKDMARAGDIVLLSPACASFDMFQNFEDRGDQFKILVNQL